MNSSLPPTREKQSGALLSSAATKITAARIACSNSTLYLLHCQAAPAVSSCRSCRRASLSLSLYCLADRPAESDCCNVHVLVPFLLRSGT